MLGGKGHFRVATKLSVFLAVAVLISMPILAVNIGMQSDAVDDDNFITQDLGTEPLPESSPIESQEAPEPIEPKGWVDKDFIISFDDEKVNDALNPAVAVTPTTRFTKEKGFAGSVHAVWDEVEDDIAELRVIMYSMAWEEDYPWKWTGEDRDIVISEKQKARPPDAVMPSIAVDYNGTIHVVWAQYDPGDPGTWEVHYINSIDNGVNWCPDKRISFWNGENEATSIPSPPKITMGMDWTVQKDKAPPPFAPLYVTWVENNKGEQQEIVFSSSRDGGQTWSGAQGDRDQIISKPDSNFAYSPCIGAGGDKGQIVHVTWKQMFQGKAEYDEIFYSNSTEYGNDKTWEIERPITDPGKPGIIETVSMAAGHHDVHVVWNQYPVGKASINEVYYAGSPNDGKDWPPEVQEIRISNDKDGQTAITPTVSTLLRPAGKAPETEVHVAWSEKDEIAQYGTLEIHYSMTTNPWDPSSWTGQKGDQVLSFPDKNEVANAFNASICMGEIQGRWQPQIVWTEFNNIDGKNKADNNNEIHTPSQFTLSVSVSPSSAGSVSISPDQSYYLSSNSVQLTANANAGYVFDSWSGDATGSTNPKTITMDGNKTIVANFVYVELVANSVSSTTSSCTEHATISIFRSFSNTGNTASSTFRYGLYLSTDSTITTGDTLIYSYALTQGAGTTNSGTIGVTLPWGTYGTFYYGLIVDYLNQVTEPYESNNWDAGNTVTITQAELTLTVSTSGDGSVTKNPNQATYHYGNTVTLTAVPDPGWAFVEWTGDIIGSANPYIVTINGNMVVTANFIPEYTQTLTTGWNRVSFPLEQSDTDISVVLSSISAYWTDVIYFDASDGADPWKSYLDEDLTDLTHNMGFWVKVSSGCTLTVQGARPGTTDINLYTGWNMIGYPAENDGSYTVADLISDTTVTCVYQEDWWFFMTELDGSHVLENGEMYWVLVSADTTWTITW